MSSQLPVILFLLPFATAICMPIVGAKRRQWCRPMAIASVIAMCIVAVINFRVVLEQGASRYAFSGWPISTSLPDHPLGIEWVNDDLASIMLVALSFLASLCLLYGGPLTPKSLGARTVAYYTLNALPD